jgi:uncharacterized membrane protein
MIRNRTRAIAGLGAVVAGVALIGTSGAAFVLGWALWATGLAALLTALPTAGEPKTSQRPSYSRDCGTFARLRAR